VQSDNYGYDVMNYVMSLSSFDAKFVEHGYHDISTHFCVTFVITGTVTVIVI